MGHQSDFESKGLPLGKKPANVVIGSAVAQTDFKDTTGHGIN